MDNCIFCKIIDGEIPSYCIYEDEYFKVIFDRFPSVLGHVIVIAKCHAQNIMELPKEHGKMLIPLIQEIVEKLDCSLETKPDGYNILQNNGEASGQTVMHFHMHIIPRYLGDDVSIEWHKKEFSDETFNDLMKRF